ncbi:MAG: heme-binding protein [Alphaproteobacteria bacterium GM202ARS2]|nr:heme-binding protein [Alphaproteobacteria bacterium GM202ARS2]
MKRLSVVVLLSVVASCAHTVEEPAYRVVKRVGDSIELRVYEPALQAEVIATGDRDNSANTAFRILFNYITGENQRAQDIAMTAPVAQQPNNADTWRVAFYMPQQFSRADVPQPTDSRVTIKRVPSRKVAVLRFSGRHSDSNFNSHAERLRGYLRKKAIAFQEPPIFAYYDPPFQLWFLRRNEVMYVLP